MNINKLPSAGRFGNAVKFTRETAVAISAVEISSNYNDKKPAQQLRDYFLWCANFLDEGILKEDEPVKKKTTKKDDT